MTPSPHVSSGYPNVRLLPPEKAHEFAYWARRLVTPGLLRDVVAIAIFRLPLLAVPVGEGHLGRELHRLHERCAKEAVAALNGRSGSPRLSIRGALLVRGARHPAHSNQPTGLRLHDLRAPGEDHADRSPSWPAGYGGCGTEVGRWPPAFEQCRNGVTLTDVVPAHPRLARAGT